MKFRAHYAYDTEAASDESAIANTEPSLTVQAHAEDADINVLMMRYGITGKMPENPIVPMYGDFSDVGDYQSALNAVIRADANFEALTPQVRARFNNNPQELLEFMENKANAEEARKLGLLKEIANDLGTRVDVGTPPQAAGGGTSKDGGAVGGRAPSGGSGAAGSTGSPGGNAA